VPTLRPHLYPDARYNALKDFKAISQILVVLHIITATPTASSEIRGTEIEKQMQS